MKELHTFNKKTKETTNIKKQPTNHMASHKIQNNKINSYGENNQIYGKVIYGEFYKSRKARFIPTFCKRINRTSTAVGSWVAAFEERRRTTFSVRKFIYNNNNKHGFTPNRTNNEYVRIQKRVQGSDRW